MRAKYVAGNWKMNMDKAGAVELAKGLVESLKGLNAKYMIAPPFVYLDAVYQITKGSNIILGAQDMAATENGAHTGAVSGAMKLGGFISGAVSGAAGGASSIGAEGRPGGAGVDGS